MRFSKPSPRYSVHLLPTVLVVLAAAFVACNQPPTPTSTPIPTTSPLPSPTPTPTHTQRVISEVRAVFNAQLEAIRDGDWSRVYEHCSPSFRQLRTVDRFTLDASSQFARDGYTAEGFEPRNVRISIRSPDRVLVTFDAYQDGQFIRTASTGQNYVSVNGRWWDNGTWCQLRVGA